jgi:kinesin family protein 18/19
VHQLEIDHLDSQSAALMRDFQIKKKDMVIARYRQHRSLADEIISRQRDLLNGQLFVCSVLTNLIS